MTSQRVLVLSPVDLDAGVPGSLRIVATCGHPCWIAPSGVVFLLGNPGAVSRCSRCVDVSDADGIEAVPGGAEELAAVLGPDLAAVTLAAVERVNETLRRRQ